MTRGVGAGDRADVSPQVAVCGPPQQGTIHTQLTDLHGGLRVRAHRQIALSRWPRRRLPADVHAIGAQVVTLHDAVGALMKNPVALHRGIGAGGLGESCGATAPDPIQREPQGPALIDGIAQRGGEEQACAVQGQLVVRLHAEHPAVVEDSDAVGLRMGSCRVRRDTGTIDRSLGPSGDGETWAGGENGERRHDSALGREVHQAGPGGAPPAQPGPAPPLEDRSSKGHRAAVGPADDGFGCLGRPSRCAAPALAG